MRNTFSVIDNRGNHRAVLAASFFLDPNGWAYFYDDQGQVVIAFFRPTSVEAV